jgi:steroid delta-isomerase-like uncharacterized protein
MTDMAQSNLEIVRELIDRFFNGHNAELAEEFFTQDLHWDGGSVGSVDGAKNYAAVMEQFWAALPDAHAAEQTAVADGDTVAMRFVVTATHTGELWGIPATGERVQWNAIMTYRFKGGRVAEQWAAEDWVAILQQIGVVTPPWMLTDSPSSH